MKLPCSYLSLLLTALLAALASGFQRPLPTQRLPTSQLHQSNTNDHENDNAQIDRRSWLLTTTAATATATLFAITTEPANAGIDPSLLRSLPVKGDETGATQRLQQVAAMNRPASDTQEIPFVELPSGVSYREYREGKGEAGTYICLYLFFGMIWCVFMSVHIVNLSDACVF